VLTKNYLAAYSAQKRSALFIWMNVPVPNKYIRAYSAQKSTLFMWMKYKAALLRRMK
jgi:hypothetical protein